MGLRVENFQLFSFCGRFLIIIELDEAVKLKDIRELKRNFEANIENRTPVFLFTKINSNRKKYLKKKKFHTEYVKRKFIFLKYRYSTYGKGYCIGHQDFVDLIVSSCFYASGE